MWTVTFFIKKNTDLGESFEVDEYFSHLLGEHLLEVFVPPHQLGKHLVPGLNPLQRGRVLNNNKRFMTGTGIGLICPKISFYTLTIPVTVINRYR